MTAIILTFPGTNPRVPSLVLDRRTRLQLARLACDKGADLDARAAAVADLVEASLPGSPGERLWANYAQRAIMPLVAASTPVAL